jgi:GDPmannose 4,6-dehydratase
MKKALVTGVTGQDGHYLVSHLCELGYDVWGVVRRTSNTKVIDELGENKKCKITLRYGDMTDSASLRRIIAECQPDEIYNLAAQSHVRISFDIPEYTTEVNGTGVVNILDAAKSSSPDARIYHASTSELYGSTPPPQSEDTKFHPRSPYGVAKLQAYWAVMNYRESYDMFVSQGILFNHESPLRPDNFVTRKITKAAAKIRYGKQDCLYLGNIDAKRDWGFAGDYVKAMHLILQHDVPDNFVISTGEAHTVREFLELAFARSGLAIESNGKTGMDEVYHNRENGKAVVRIDERFYRPAEVDYLCGDCSKSKKELGWSPEVDFDGLINMMVDSDCREESK